MAPTRIYQNGLTGERREVALEDCDWYERSGAPWYRADPVAQPDPYSPAKSETKATTKKD
jgi:hypothetical protein